MMRASLLILNYNGKSFLQDCFSSIGVATRKGRDHDVYLVDNCSTDDSLNFTNMQFPWVRCIRAKRNALEFTYNDVLPDIETEGVLLLNNDVIVEPDFLPPLIDQLVAPDVFAVTTRILTGDRVTPQGARTSGGYHSGLWWYHQLPDIDRASTSFFAPNQAIFSRSKFLEIGGFDELLWPIYHVDIDLSYKAWRRGWRVLCEPASVLYHLGGQTKSKEGREWHRAVVTQNTFLIQWKNVDDPQMRREHLAWLPARLARAAATGDVSFLKGFREATRRYRRMQVRREQERPMRCVPDREAFARLMAGIDGV